MTRSNCAFDHGSAATLRFAPVRYQERYRWRAFFLFLFARNISSAYPESACFAERLEDDYLY